MKFKIQNILAAAALTAVMVSCGSDEWTPGPEAPADCINVYFEPMSQTSYKLTNDDPLTIPVTLRRGVVAGEVSVPVNVVSASEGFSVPQNVTFAAGEATAIMNIDCSDLPFAKTGSITVAIDPSYTSPYSAGSTDVTVDVTVSQWLTLCDNMEVYFERDGFSMITQRLLLLEGTLDFKIPNFLNSGVDLVFNIDRSANNIVIPISNVKWFSELFPDEADDYKSWYLYDEAEGIYPEWWPNGDAAPGITLCKFSGDDYTYFNIPNGAARFDAYVEYTDGSTAWTGFNIYFTPLFDPFEGK